MTEQKGQEDYVQNTKDTVTTHSSLMPLSLLNVAPPPCVTGAGNIDNTHEK